MSSIKALVDILAPPRNPAEVSGVCNWQEVEAWLGFALPDDYKEFVTTYGSGAVDDFLWVLNPFSENKYLNLIEQAAVQLDVQRQVTAYSGDATPYPLFPDAKGLFPWGITDNGDLLFWLCEGAAADWTIVICDSKCYRWQEFKMPAIGFLIGYLAMRLTVDIFPTDAPTERPEFRPV